MPDPLILAKAELQEITWQGNPPQVVELERRMQVQFNPETLKLSFANQTSGGDQRGGSATQFTARGTTKLSFDLWFDVTAPLPDVLPQNDVRKLTEQVVQFMLPSETDGAPPGVRFQWGTFVFEGVMESVNESIEFFSEDGRPLRASVSVNLSQQEIQFKFGEPQPPGLGGSPAAPPAPQPAQQGDTLQGMAAERGKADKWRQIAEANNVENPRRIAPGSLLNLSELL